MSSRFRRTVCLTTACLLLTALGTVPALSSSSRIKDIAVLNGMGRHKLIGYGLVSGLEGSGDSDTSVLTSRGIANILENFGVRVNHGDFKAKNLAAVMVTAELPPVVSVGGTLDVTVSSIADAKSLQGGFLLLTPLRAADDNIYAIAQGPVTVGGFRVETRSGDAVQKNHVTVGRVTGGASVVKSLSTDLRDLSQLSLSLLRPDFTTAARIAEAINRHFNRSLAAATDNATVRITVPEADRANPVGFIVSLENLPVQPDTAARVVINERTGTVIIGSHVRILPVAISHGGLTVEIRSSTKVYQPPPLVGINTPAGHDQSPAATDEAAGPAAGVNLEISAQGLTEAAQRGRRDGSLTGGETVVVEQHEVRTVEQVSSLAAIPPQATLDDLVTALNALGVRPRDLIAIITALKEANALEAELIVL